MSRKLLMLVALVSSMWVASAGGCRSCSNCNDYDSPVAGCDSTGGCQRTGSVCSCCGSGGCATGGHVDGEDVEGPTLQGEAEGEPVEPQDSLRSDQ